MPWIVHELTFGWPPNVKVIRTPGDMEVLHPLFTFLEDKRLLLYGYGTSAGITDLDDLAVRIDNIRDGLRPALEKLRPKAAIAAWLRKLGKACHELLGTTYKAMAEARKTGRNPEPSDIVPAVNQLREAFCLVATHVSAVYQLPAAENLHDLIRKDIDSPPAQNR